MMVHERMGFAALDGLDGLGQESFTSRVEVFDAYHKTFVKDARVALREAGPEGSVVAQGVSDRGGNVLFRDITIMVPQTPLLYVVSAPGYMTTTVPARRGVEGTQRIEILPSMKARKPDWTTYALYGGAALGGILLIGYFLKR